MTYSRCLLIESGASLKFVSERLGHSMKITADTYLHIN